MLYKNVPLSRPIKVYWAGWETTTTALQQNGWELSQEKDYRRQSLRIAIRHKNCNLYGVTKFISYDYAEYSIRHKILPPFNMQYMANKVQVNVMDNYDNFKPIDAMPQIRDVEIKNIEDFNIFATPLVRTEEIIVNPETVSDLLIRIKEMQMPEQERIIKQKRLREHREGEVQLQQKFHAQILSIA